MKRLVIALFVLALPAAAQVSVQVSVPPPPSIVFTAPPPLVTVEPGIQVVEDYDGEVFFVDGYYWHRYDGRWFRTRDWHGGWVFVDAPYVPALIVRQPYGRWRHYHPRAVVAPPAAPRARTVVVAPPPPPLAPPHRRAVVPAPPLPPPPGHAVLPAPPMPRPPPGAPVPGPGPGRGHGRGHGKHGR